MSQHQLGILLQGLHGATIESSFPISFNQKWVLFLLNIVTMQPNSKQLGVMLDGKEFVAIALTVIKTMCLTLFLDQCLLRGHKVLI